MKFYLAIVDDTGEPWSPPSTKLVSGYRGTPRVYTTARKARAAVGRKRGISILEMDTEYGLEVDA